MEDALFSSNQVAKMFFLATLFTLIHSLVNFFQVMTLCVAVNAHNQALLSLLLSNQFVELKGNVFKRFNPTHINKLAHDDVIERFYIFLFLGLILIRNLHEVDWDLTQLENTWSTGNYTYIHTYSSLKKLLLY